MIDMTNIAGRLYRDLKQSKPFGSLEEALFISLNICGQQVAWEMQRVLKQKNLSDVQYNILRILRGAGNQGRSCGEISERLITRVPDITRLLDRLESRKLIERKRCTEDRRIVRSYIAPAALQLLEQMDPVLGTMLKQSSAHLSEEEKNQLLSLLEKFRTGSESQNQKIE